VNPANGPAGDRYWRDGSEDYLVEVLSSTTDRSTASDELAAHVIDWPTRYHFARARTNLLHPLGLGPGLRVLDVGAGSGVAARAAADRGASVVAVEGDARRAEAAAVRCAGLDVEVVHGTVSDLGSDQRDFDVVLCIGVLEYAGDDPAAFLGRLVDRLAPSGTLAVAIENRFGLAYWLGGDEDHLARPWVGLEGYPAQATTTATANVRTHGRRDLAALLDGAGLTAQRWLTPWPDYKLPTAILAEAIHDQPDAVNLVDQLVGPPLDHSRMGGGFDGDERAVLRGAVEGGLGVEMANSFLVLAGKDHGTLDARCDPDILAWRFTGDRRKAYLRVRTVRQPLGDSAGSRTIDRRSTHSADRTGSTVVGTDGWLRIRPADGPPEPYVLGPTLEQVALGHLRDGDRLALADVLGRWAAIAEDAANDRDVATWEAHPYLTAGRRRVLPGHHLDLGLDNLAGADGEGLPTFVDDEWEAVNGVDLQLAAIRACWKLASVAVHSGTRHPWATSASVDDLTVTFCDLLPLDVGADPLDRLLKAESELRAVALGGDATSHAAQLRAAGRRSLSKRSVGTGPVGGIRGRLARLRCLPIVGPPLAGLARLVRRL